MKKITLFLILLFVAISYSAAQKSVALHSNGTTTIFGGDTPLVEAYDASITGDTLYVSGGNFTMPGTIDKGLVIIGAGYHPEFTAATQKTYIMNTGNIILGSNASDLYMEGMEFNSGLSKSSVVVMDFTLIRCKINGSLSFLTGSTGDPTNATIAQCNISGNVSLQGVTYSLISNCILSDRILYSKNNVFKNNVITNESGFGVLADCDINSFINNIFTTSNLISDGNCSYNTFQYNIFVSLTPFLATEATDINNYKGIDMATVFENASEGDYHLLGDASTTYVGDDGTEVGIYGGILPFKEGAVPINPHISQKSIQTTTDSNGLLNISFTVEAQQN